MINEQVKKILEENLWELATSSNDEVNVVPVAFKNILGENKVAIADVFMKKTIENLEVNPKVAISVFDSKTMEGYQLKGTAVHMTEGEEAENAKKTVKERTKGGLVAKGIVLVTVEKIYVTTPGPDNNKQI